MRFDCKKVYSSMRCRIASHSKKISLLTEATVLTAYLKHSSPLANEDISDRCMHV